MSTLKLGLGVIGSLLVSSLLLADAPVMQRPDAIGITLGETIDYHVVATGSPTLFTADNLPSGVVIDPATGWIHGKPTDVSISYLKVSAANADGTSSVDLTISVVAADAAPLIYAPLLYDAYQTAQPGGDQFSLSLKATGSPSKLEAADLPEGWTFAGDTLSGSATTPGLYSVSVNATNTYGIGSAAVTVRVHPACTQCDQSVGTLHAGDVFRVTLTFNQPVSFSGAAPYLTFHTSDGSPTRRVAYVSGNGTNQLIFGYTVSTADVAGDVILDPVIAPAAGASVSGLADSLGLEAGASLPLGSPSIPTARIAASTTIGGTTSASAGDGVGNGSSLSASSGATTGTSSSGSSVTSSAPSQPATVGSTDSSSATTPQDATGSASTGTIAGNSTTTGSSSSASSGGDTGSTTAGSDTAVTPTGTTETPLTSGATPTPAPRAQLVNLSARGLVDSGSSFIAGFIVSGTSPKRMLLRAAGPALSAYGVSNPLPDPAIRVLDAAGNVVLSSDSSDATSPAVASSVGAFAFPAGGKDAAVTATLAPGTYSMQVLPNGGSGVVLAEVYDAGDAASSAPLVNLSSRGHVGSGEDVLTAGFVVAGNAPKTLLVRGVGPALAAHGVASVLTHPVITVFQGATALARNAGWDADASANTTAVAAATAEVGAFPLARGAADAALLVTVQPGVYTAAVTSADGQPGAALVEVYEVR